MRLQTLQAYDHPQRLKTLRPVPRRTLTEPYHPHTELPEGGHEQESSQLIPRTRGGRRRRDEALRSRRRPRPPRLRRLRHRRTWPRAGELRGSLPPPLVRRISPNTAQLDKTTLALIAAREIPAELVSAFTVMPKATDPMRVLQAAVAMLGMSDPDTTDNSARGERAQGAAAHEPDGDRDLRAIIGVRSGQDPIRPASDLSHAANFLSTCSRASGRAGSSPRRSTRASPSTPSTS